jgi:hypothetical protein
MARSGPHADHPGRNYETRATAEWLCSTECGSVRIGHLIAQAKAAAPERGQQPQWILADWLRDAVEDGAMEIGSTLHRELLRAALGHVDWDDVAEQILLRDRNESAELSAPA